MADDLTKMDRWNSEPLDVHTWSDHPEIKTLCDDLYDLAGMSILEPKGNRKAKRTVKESLRVLILDFYVKWLKDPSISIGFNVSGGRGPLIFQLRLVDRVKLRSVGSSSGTTRRGP